ncbi:MAG: hypothetical protein ACRDRO_23495 [Pseudonocardiaceae bacterium]
MIAGRDELCELIKGKLAERTALDVEIKKLNSEREALDLYLIRHGVHMTIVSPDEAVLWRVMNRPKAVVAVLCARNAPGSPQEISEHLHRMGRADEPAQVSRALDRLKKQHRVRSAGRGLWAPVDPGQ